MGFWARLRRPKWSGTRDWLGKKWASARDLPDGWKDRLSGWTQAVKARIPKSMEDLKRLEPEAAFERFRQLASGKAYGTYLRLGGAAFAAYFMADTVSLFTDSLVPEPPTVPPPPIVKREDKRRGVDEYGAIISRNIFSSQGLIPEEGQESLATGPARKTSLPLNLIGTVVLKNELKSIAAIEDKSVNMVFPVRIDDTIDNKIRITKIEHLKVYFINKSTGFLEYVEIVEDMPQLQTQPAKTSAAGGQKKGGVTQTDDTHFEVERRSVDAAVSNLNQVLQDARAIPNFENGMPDGYKILQIVPGSIYDQLGIKNGDVISALNGDPINDPGKAFQMFNELKTASHLEIKVKRSGRTMVMNYDIR